ncbi:TD and POZ domain-containing protein 1 [Araneus ventricosus]|uniref:TD and POZ domain-containing protein 1 n=1 Tax=Araneus ventricosus TaxID=182803 RepID=A0A4Y2HPB1_ARAVE|nr:TD and POZ domain-containing protein 1 [Araneus ventricosus]
MLNFYVYQATACALLLAYFLLYPSSDISDSNDHEIRIQISDLRMIDLCESMSVLHQNGLFSDLTIVVEDEFKVHKSILSARSEVFHQMLESQKDLDRIVVEGMSKKAMSQMLFFIYTGHTEELSVETAVELFLAADKYKLSLLKKLCSDIMVQNLNMDNVIEFLSLSSKHYDENLQKASVDFIVASILAVREHSKWLEFIETHPKLVDQVIESLASKK